MRLLYQRLFRFENGERFPVLLWAESPAFLPNVYLVAMRRPRGLSSNTLKRDGRAIMHLYAWACSECVDVEARFEAGKFLSSTEIESLARACYLEYGCLTNALNAGKGKSLLLPMPGTSQVASQTTAVRIDSIVGYLDWLATQTIHRVPDSALERRCLLEKSRSDMEKALLAQRPTKRGRNTIGFREGLSKSARSLLLTVVSPLEMGTMRLPSSTNKYEWHPENPWRHHPVRVRNFLMILFLYQLGVRAGELLAVKVADINFTNNTVLIRRSPDDPGDPRLYEPNTKTRDRVLPINDALAGILQRYLYEVRRQWVYPKGDHGYLWTSSQDSGAPLSMSGLKSMWATLRKRVPDLPEDIASHVLRHTWNDRFSEAKDRNRSKPPTLIEQNLEEQERSYLMGWKPTSDTAQSYTRRHNREASQKASLEMQDDLWSEET